MLPYFQRGPSAGLGVIKISNEGRGENETSCDGERSNHFCGYQNLHQQQVTTNPASKIAERETKAVMLGANPGHTLFI